MGVGSQRGRCGTQPKVHTQLVEPAGLRRAPERRVDHLGLDDNFWMRMRSEFSPAEIVELSMCLGSWLAFGRLNHVLGLDAACTLPGHTP